MDFRLRVFLAVAGNLSFTKASKELLISQPAITKHVQELENAYKVQLFNRQGGRIALTPEGELFRGYAEKIIEQYEILKCEMDLSRTAVSGELKIGADGIAAKKLFDAVVQEFAERFPNVKLSFVMAAAQDIGKAVENGCLHLAIMDSPESEYGLKIIPESGLAPQAEAFKALCMIKIKKYRLQ